MTAWAVIPVFNEAATVRGVVEAARRHAPVLVVDDGSSDDSALIAGTAGAEVIRHPRRLGKGDALRTGINAACARGATLIATLDGDGQHDASDLPVLLAAATERTIVVGNRLARGGQGASPGRLNASRVAGFFVNWVGGVRVEDSQSGFRIYPASLLAEVVTRRGGFVFETEVLIAAVVAGYRVEEVPVRLIPRAGRGSRFHPVADGVAIGSYLAGRAFGRWAVETRDGLRAVAAVFGRERARVRHADLLATVGGYGNSLGSWGSALGTLTVARAASRVAGWWCHPRRRRATVAAWASLAAPGVLLLVLAQALIGRGLPDVVSPLVGFLYSQERLGEAWPPARR